VFDRIIIVCLVGASAIAIAHSGNALFAIARRYELQSNAKFNEQLIEQVQRERAANANR
jgi:hypothetical protein